MYGVGRRIRNWWEYHLWRIYYFKK